MADVPREIAPGLPPPAQRLHLVTPGERDLVNNILALIDLLGDGDVFKEGLVESVRAWLDSATPGAIAFVAIHVRQIRKASSRASPVLSMLQLAGAEEGEMQRLDLAEQVRTLATQIENALPGAGDLSAPAKNYFRTKLGPGFFS